MKQKKKCHHLHCLNTLHLLRKQMEFALCLQGHQPWALPDQQRKCLLLKIPSCLSPQQTWQKCLLKQGTSLPLLLAVTARITQSRALPQMLIYFAWSLNVSAEAQAQKKGQSLGPKPWFKWWWCVLEITSKGRRFSTELFPTHVQRI